MTRVLIAGSFDPVTRGHLDVIARAAGLFCEVVVGVANNDDKHYLFSATQRAHLVSKAVGELPNVQVVSISGLVARWGRDNGVDFIVKGLRNSADWEHELVQARANQDISGIETLFLPTAPELAHVSSSLVRQLVQHGQDVSAYVSDSVAHALAKLNQVPATEGYDHE